MRGFTLWILLLLFGSLSFAEASFFGDLFKKAEKSQTEIDEPAPSPYDKYFKKEKQTPKKVIFEEKRRQDTDETLYDAPIHSKSIFLSYLSAPSTLYLRAHQPIEVRALIADLGVRSVSTRFIGAKDLEILNPNSSWKKVGEGEYRNRFYYKALSKGAKFPSIEVIITDKSGRKYKERLGPLKSELIALPESPNFSRIICKEFKLLSHHQKKYDEKSNIVVLEINATESNLEDFHLPYATREGIDQIKRDGEKQYIYYFAILPNSIKKVKFTYFQRPAKKYRNVSFDMILKDSKISTQTDLNPQKSRLQKYKQYAIIGLAVFLLLLFFFYRKWYLLFLALLAAIYLLYGEARIKKIVLPAGTKIKILPTENSTIFYTTPQTVQADLLLKKNGYIKVMLPNKKIGWIKAE
ncbi:MAG: hypothetical protein B6D59_04100 [Campylobacteraceae bacterium 4484_4]|nr:MAG: hypothetical protein B6D59_04100 [Campylobacteraceae bacterium 4484_4]